MRWQNLRYSQAPHKFALAPIIAFLRLLSVFMALSGNNTLLVCLAAVFVGLWLYSKTSPHSPHFQTFL